MSCCGDGSDLAWLDPLDTDLPALRSQCPVVRTEVPCPSLIPSRDCMSVDEDIMLSL